MGSAPVCHTHGSVRRASQPGARRGSPGATLAAILYGAIAGSFHESVSSVQLFMPDLVPPGTATTATPTLPKSLRRLLARARASRVPAEDYVALLCGAFGVERQRDWPVAPLTLMADGLDPGAHYWLRADPVHLRADQANLVLLEGRHIPIADAEAGELVDALNRHFAADALAFHAPSPRRWYVRPPTQAEIRIPINSLWFWGGGVLPPPQAPKNGCFWSDDPLARGLALWAGLTPYPLPDEADAVLARTAEHWIALEPPGNGHSTQTLERWDRTWFAPLHAALSRRVLDRLRLHAFHAGQALSFELVPSDLWKVWRRRVPLPVAHA
jgi:hypothetical protein